jgi:hypothetical protein
MNQVVEGLEKRRRVFVPQIPVKVPQKFARFFRL